MAIEIERKFLVLGDQWKTATPTYFCQGYLSRDKYRTVRVRIAGEIGTLTIKGPSVGMTREEFEYEIPLDDAQSMLKLSEQPLIEKNRRLVQHEGLTWEVDEFLGDNAGLVIAEIELESENQSITKPDWVGDEVTDDPRYFNSNLSIKPYSTWN
jgi:CYTH domain-containing protein